MQSIHASYLVYIEDLNMLLAALGVREDRCFAPTVMLSEASLLCLQTTRRLSYLVLDCSVHALCSLSYLSFCTVLGNLELMIEF